MGELIDFPNNDTTLADLEVANQKLAQKLHSMGYGIDAASLIGMRLDLLVEMLTDGKQRAEFELQFQLKVQEMLEQMVRHVTFNVAPSGLVVPK